MRACTIFAARAIMLDGTAHACLVRKRGDARGLRVHPDCLSENS
jgi:hypothetical protein